MSLQKFEYLFNTPQISLLEAFLGCCSLKGCNMMFKNATLMASVWNAPAQQHLVVQSNFFGLLEFFYERKRRSPVVVPRFADFVRALRSAKVPRGQNYGTVPRPMPAQRAACILRAGSCCCCCEYRRDNRLLEGKFFCAPAVTDRALRLQSVGKNQQTSTRFSFSSALRICNAAGE